ncbi:MAG TPA: HRDC domain-containing protein [Kofleriaceae bacterium]|nr:HRDC domain-containing protein [Kofleriaceae bacterium]
MLEKLLVVMCLDASRGESNRSLALRWGVALVTEPADVAAIAAELSRAPLVAFDLEFLSQDRLVPTLCLLQVSWLPANIGLDAPAGQIVAVEPPIRLIDPLAVDVRPVIEALAAHPLVVAHAPRQDLGLLATRFKVSMPGIVDTQLMAAFTGIGDQVGLAALANELLGTSLGKDQQWTAWERRPLSDAQITYAAADVRYLPALYALLAEKLGPRIAWVREESRAVLDDALAASAVTPETAWENVGGARYLDAASHAALVAMAAWRQQTAIDMDRPLGQVLNEKTLVELAKSRPDTANEIRGIKGISPIAKTRAQEIVDALAVARTAPAKPAAPRPPSRAASPRAQRWSELLLAIVQLVSDETGIAARLLGTRSDAEAFARTVDEHGLDAAKSLPALSTWRREVLGQVWEGWLAGTVALRGDTETAQGMRLVWKAPPA